MATLWASRCGLAETLYVDMQPCNDREKDVSRKHSRVKPVFVRSVYLRETSETGPVQRHIAQPRSDKDLHRDLQLPVMLQIILAAERKPAICPCDSGPVHSACGELRWESLYVLFAWPACPLQAIEPLVDLINAQRATLLRLTLVSERMSVSVCLSVCHNTKTHTGRSHRLSAQAGHVTCVVGMCVCVCVCKPHLCVLSCLRCLLLR